MANILYLSYDGLTDPLGQSQILPYIEGLSKKGHKFSLISFEKPERFKEGKRRIEKRCAAANIDWHPLEYTKNPPVLSTLYDIDKLHKKSEELHNKENFALVHCRSYITSLVGLRLKENNKLPFIFDMRGFWADERVDGKIWNLSNPVYKSIYRYFKKKERKFLEKADAVVSLTEAGKSEIENWFNNDPIFGGNENYYNYDRAAAVLKKTTIIPCATDLNHFDFTRISTNKRKWLGAVYGIDTDREYLGYVGSLGTWYMAEEMLALYHHLLQSRPKLRFLILSHDNLDKLREKADKRGIPRSFLVQIAAERKDVPALMSMMAASVFFILPAYSKKASSPTKQGELMAMGIPVICNDNVGDTGTIVRKYNSGYVNTDFNSVDFQKISDNWDEIIHLNPENIRHGAEDYFSLEKGIEAYRRIYERILDNQAIDA
ncbi:glycosyltransferase family 4 protein [Cryomorpha ignava]|uniref:Glycosyltransferase family 4 protein n=1 Tax=Cryomorpha ignava TaxID=101383 RepID=A0A7K3WPI4_9FLAO|nr:glycosyltransferase family 4 protein [Cryomorpha ignava]NEN23414.1 glycosyltransferase family 4 protein [Cryomorpha ignava]